MSASDPSRSATRNPSHRPSTPDHSKTSVTRSVSASVSATITPKSKYLQSALQAKRAQNTSTFAIQTRPTSSLASTTSEDNSPPSTSLDDFARFALSEEQTAPVSPVRGRRPSDFGMPRAKTNRDLTNEIDKLKDGLIDANMRIQLLKKSNYDLQHELTNSKERVEELEPLEDEILELRDENDSLRLKMSTMDEEIVELRANYDRAQQTNEEWIAINEECTSHFEEQQLAVQEAAEAIIALETEKSMLRDEIKGLLERVTALEDGSRAGTTVDGSSRCPSRVFSIDESRPSTSHFDSDYYSQPDSPQVKPSGDSTISITPSERSKKFLDLTEDRRRSTHELLTRMSAASLKRISARSPSPAPAVPQIPTAYSQHIPQIVEQNITASQPKKPPRRYRDRQLPPQHLLDATQVSPTKSGSTTPITPIAPPGGLRGYYHADETFSDRPSSSDRSNRMVSARPRSRQPSGAEIAPRMPLRVSSRVAHTSNSNEHIATRSPHDIRQRQSEPEIGGTAIKGGKGDFQAWASSSMPPPPVPSARADKVTSISSASDLTTEVDVYDENRHWRNLDRLNQPQLSYQRRSSITTHNRTQSQSRPPPSPTMARSHSHVGPVPLARQDVTAKVMKTPSKERDANGMRRSQTQPNTPTAIPCTESKFLFNPEEDEDTFLRKAMGKLTRR